MVEGLIENRVATVPVTTSEERLWAAIAHGSGLLTLVVSISTLGLGALPLVFVPFVVYLVYREKSRFVAFHAAQALALQVIGTVGYFVALLAVSLVALLVTIIGGVLVVILIGLVVLVVAVLLWAVVLPALWGFMPLILGALSAIAAIETSSGRDYRYPYIGAWIEDWLNRAESTSIPGV
jgi:uncharacterized protein